MPKYTQVGGSATQENRSGNQGGGAPGGEERKYDNMQGADTSFATCPQCKKHPMKVKTAKTGSVFIACTGFPECKTTMNLPKALESINMVDETCSECFKRDKKQVKKFRLDFVTDFVNE